MTYSLPAELSVEADGPVRTVTLNRPAELNAINQPLHRALANVCGHSSWPSDLDEFRAAVRDWCQAHVPADWRGARLAVRHAAGGYSNCAAT